MTLEASSQKILGPFRIIGSIDWDLNGPTMHVHQKHPLQEYQAHLKSQAASVEMQMDPRIDIGSIFYENTGSIWNYREHLLRLKWAHA